MEAVMTVWGMTLTSYLHLVPRSRMRGAISPLPHDVFMAWCSIKAQGHALKALRTLNISSDPLTSSNTTDRQTATALIIIPEYKEKKLFLCKIHTCYLDSFPLTQARTVPCTLWLKTLEKKKTTAFFIRNAPFGYTPPYWDNHCHSSSSS
jgi:hypothetical protein